ncbi:MAG: molybdopterin-dependent oxidoreductase, partial [Gemmatimonadetes bacterium]|nr:molybdopterin-dependent oxidoreductase [Gemmatimonadota bacterium]NIS03100.1 molybdopterin-dependent oxidoreductase [Gemmatimonadota bacterium]NIU53985.1 molybdopterin-dependent oxidoreductase [Gemmatimonadota bacterium]NIV25488.1 molybdopterin-dependent oxidoreductase [Gemmatimonadota bacterium]NIW37915.1 molybdopterin-dependent oxidoreductase [Gemmatimonadota bacterium]
DFRVVVEQFLTDTAREADIVLPAKTMFEQSDVIGAYWHPYIQLKQKVIEPPGEVKPESEVYRLLAREVGCAEAGDHEVFPVSDAEVT